MPETLLIKSDFPRAAEWNAAFAAADLQVRHWEELDWRSPAVLAEIDYALVWRPPPGMLAKLPNLKIIFSIGAGLDHLRGAKVLPAGVPVVRMVESTLTAGMTEYVVYQVLRFHRHFHIYAADARAQIWRPRPQIPAADRRIGILGCGVLGAAAARALVGLGFQVAVWSRTPKHIRGVTSHHGAAQLADCLRVSEILVCLLPLTAATENILNAALFAQLPRGACVINAARGRHCVAEDLQAALDSGQLAAAALDVFADEPLPAESPLWRHPRIHITPHIASQTLPAGAARRVLANIRRWRRGRPLTHIADMALSD